MRTIKNLTSSPLRVPLPRGKTLHLGPGESGSIRDEAADHAPLRKLVEAGSLQLGASTPHGAAPQGVAGVGHGDTATHGNPSMPRKSGER